MKHIRGFLSFIPDQTRPDQPSLFGDGSVGPLCVMARVQRLLGDSAVDVHVVISPRGNVSQRRQAAVGQGGHLRRVQQPVPEVEVGEFTNQGLGGVEVAPQRVLEWRRVYNIMIVFPAL